MTNYLYLRLLFWCAFKTGAVSYSDLGYKMYGKVIYDLSFYLKLKERENIYRLYVFIIGHLCPNRFHNYEY